MLSSSTTTLFALLLTLFLSVHHAAATLGFNSAVSSGIISQSQFTTIKNAGYVNFAGVYFNGAIVNNSNTLSGLRNGVHTDGIQSIRNANIVLTLANREDAIHVPVYTVSQPLSYPGAGTRTNIYAQARKPIDYLNSYGAQIGRTYVVVDRSAGSRWSAVPALNEAFLTEFLSYFPGPLGPQAGILSNQAEFQAIFGTSYTPKDSNNNPVELMWRECGGSSDLNTPPFTPFNNAWTDANGWNTIQVKEYQCNVNNVGGATGVSGNLTSHA